MSFRTNRNIKNGHSADKADPDFRKTQKSGRKVGIKIKHGNTSFEAEGPDPNGSTTEKVCVITVFGILLIVAVIAGARLTGGNSLPFPRV